MNAMTDLQILQGTRDVLVRDGWSPLMFIDSQGCRCIRGAMAVAMEGDKGLRNDFGATRFTSALALLRTLTGAQSIDIWNGHHTFADVLALLDAAIAIAREQAQPAEVV